MHSPACPLTIPLSAGRSAETAAPNRKILAGGLLLLCPVSDVLTGIQYMMLGEDLPINGSRVWKALVIAAALLLASTTRRTIAARSDVFAWTAGLGLLGLINGLLYGGAELNIVVFFQTQCYFCALLVLLAVVPPKDRRQIIAAYMWSIWCCASFTVIFGLCTGWNNDVYHGYATKGLFRAGNDLCYQFVCASAYLLFCRSRGAAVLAAMLAISATTLWLIGTKAGLLGLPFLIGWCRFVRLSRSKTLTLVLAGTALLLAALYHESVFLMVLDYLPQAEHYHRFLKDTDVFRVLLSGRDVMADAAFAIIGRFNLWQWLAGTGAYSYQTQVADLLRLDMSRRTVELDWLDMFGSAGILGCYWFYGLLAKIMRTSLVQQTADTTLVSGWVVFTFLFSLIAGHVAGSSSSLAMVAMFFALSMYQDAEGAPRGRRPAGIGAGNRGTARPPFRLSPASSIAATGQRAEPR